MFEWKHVRIGVTADAIVYECVVCMNECFRSQRFKNELVLRLDLCGEVIAYLCTCKLKHVRMMIHECRSFFLETVGIIGNFDMLWNEWLDEQKWCVWCNSECVNA